MRDASTAEGPYSIRITNQGIDSLGNINLINRSLSFYDSQGRQTKSVSGIGPGHPGVETRYQYDARGRQVRQIGAPVQTVEAKEPLRLVTETEYDDQGRAFRTWTNIRGRDLGTDVLIDKQFAQSTTQLFDHLGRAYKTLLPDGSSTQIGFDKWGNTISETDAMGHTKLNEYDGNGRLIAVTLPPVADPLDSDADGNSGLDAPRFDYAYDWSGNQTVLQDSLGRRTIFSFDSTGRQLSRTLPMGQQEFFSCNDLGQQVTHTSFEGIVTESIYDNGTTNGPSSHVDYRVGSGRLIEQRFYASNADFNNGSSSAKEVRRFSYDAFGRKLSVERLARSMPGGALQQTRLERWFYDILGRLIQEATPEGTINYAYNPVTGQKIRMWTTKTAGLAAANLADAVDDTRYSYNELGWLTGVTVVEKNDSLLIVANQEKTSYDCIATIKNPEFLGSRCLNVCATE